MPSDLRYRDEEWLREQYIENGLRMDEVAEECGSSKTTICDWLHRHGIPTRDGAHDYETPDEPYTDPDWLRGKYYDERLGMREIGELCGVTGETIRRWMERFGFERRSWSEATRVEWEGDEERREQIGKTFREANRRPWACYFTDQGGYNVFSCSRNNEQVRHNRLLATLKVDSITDLEGMDVHHKNGIPWDDRLENLEVLTREEHGKLTQEELGWVNQYEDGRKCRVNR